MSVRHRAILRSGLLLPFLLVTGCAGDTIKRATTPVPDPRPTSAPDLSPTPAPGTLTILVPLALTERVVRPGATISGTVTYTNLTAMPITVRNIVIASRPGSGLASDVRETDFSPGRGKGAYIDGVPWDLRCLDAFEARARRMISIVHWGQSWWRDG